ncbi:MAG: peptide chain release factor N(5)-glutamine methyltransferase [Parcubacteria group bacterium]|nr:peptide chain release factor N(5)-glutamine methyltransferase [Parcubacteria group bacterium]
MMIREALLGARQKLMHLEAPGLDSEVLLAHVLAKPREHALLHPEEVLDDEQAGEFGALIARRANHEPVAYLVRRKEFYGRNFYVDQRVHIPRPATEDLVDAVKRELPPDFGGTIADIGTGSGCIAVTLALEFPAARVFVTDMNEDALAVARQNAEHHARIEATPPLGASLPLMERITFLHGSLGEPLTTPVDVLVANLPYGWQDGWTRDAEVLFQPDTSYLSGNDGLRDISKLIQQLPRLLTKNGRAYLEFDPRQTAAIKKLAGRAGYAATITRDMAGFERIVRLAAS